jgi:branched-chain amino acid transport system permease protein
MLGQQLLNALMLGSVYSALAVGFTLFFGIFNLINFAHGEIYMLGAFSALWLYHALSLERLPPLLALLILLLWGMLSAGVLGVVVERTAFRGVRHSPVLMLLLRSVAVSLILRESIALFVPNGANPHMFPTPFAQTTYVVGSTVFTPEKILFLGFALAMVIGLHFWIYRTNIGKWIRAGSEDWEAAQMMGVNIGRVSTWVFFVGSALGGAAGVMTGVTYGSIIYNMGIWAGLKGFTAAVIGGLGHVRGALIGGYVLAILEVLITGYIPSGSAYRDLFVFVVLVIALAIRNRAGETR